MPDFSKYSAYFDSLSDYESRYYFEKQVVSDLIEDQTFNTFKDKNTFVGEVLLDCQECTNVAPRTDGEEKVYVTKMRIEGVDDKLWDHPTKIKDTRVRQKCIDSHQTAFITTDVGIQGLPKPGDKVECYYAVAGPNDQGKLRGLQFRSEVLSSADSTTAAIYAEISSVAGEGPRPTGDAQKSFQNRGAVPLNVDSLDANAAQYSPDNYTKPNEQFLKNIYASFGETYTRPIVGDVRLVAVRFPIKPGNLNSYRDVLNVFYSTSNGIQVKTYQMTTSPGQLVLEGGRTYGAGGSANIASPQWTKRMWKLDFHPGSGTKKYRAGSQSRGGSKTYFYRDNNNNSIPDNEVGPNVSLKFNSVGLNFHRSHKDKRSTKVSGFKKGGSGKTYSVKNGKWERTITGFWTYGGGCQVLSDPNGFREIISVMENNKVQNNIEHYDYILLNYENYQTLLKGIDERLSLQGELYAEIVKG